MTPIADMVQEMIARGVPADLIVMAVRAAESCRVESPVDKTAEKRRAYDRARKAKQRLSTGNPPEIPPDGENALSLTSSQEIQKEKEGKKERKRGETIPPDWAPSEAHFLAGRKLGYSDEQILEQAEDMRLWAQSNAHRPVARKSDWDLTFHGWLRRNRRAKSEQNRRDGGNSAPSSGSLLGAIEEMRAGLAADKNADVVQFVPARSVPGPEGVHGPNRDGSGAVRPAGGGHRNEPTDWDPAGLQVSAKYRGTG
jgi:hypothetical protein